MTSLEMPIRLVSEANQREHWAKKSNRAREQRLAVARWWYAQKTVRDASRDMVPLPCTVTIVRVAPRELDDDNLRTACKAVRDQVAVELGLPCRAQGRRKGAPIADDRDPRVTWAYSQRKGKPKQYSVLIEIEPRSINE